MSGETPKMSDKKPVAAIDPQIVRELAAILRDSGLTEIEVEHGELRLRLASAHPPMQAPVYHAPAPIAQLPAPAPAAPPPAAAAPDDRAHPGVVPSPMVGTAYLAPEPDAPHFIKVGDAVNEGQTLMVVEAMKTFNPIPAPRAGRVAKICVTDKQPVEFGQPLVILE